MNPRFLMPMKTTVKKLLKQAEQKRLASRHTEAIPLILKAKRLCARDKPLAMECHISLAHACRMTGRYKKAAEAYQAAYNIAAKLKDNTTQTDCLVGMGLSLRGLGFHREAIFFFNRALTGYKKTGDATGQAFAVWAKAGALRIRGDLKGAIRMFNEAKGIFQRLRDQGGVGYCLTGLGGASRIAGKTEDSLRFYKQANGLFKRQRDRFGVAYSYCGIANALRMKGDFKGSLKYFDMARKNYRKIGDKVSYAYTLWGEANSYLFLLKPSLAEKDIKDAEGLFRETRDNRGLILCSISRCQMGCLKNGRKDSLTNALVSAYNDAKEAGFRVEALYAKSVLKAFLKGPETLPLNLA